MKKLCEIMNLAGCLLIAFFSIIGFYCMLKDLTKDWWQGSVTGPDHGIMDARGQPVAMWEDGKLSKWEDYITAPAKDRMNEKER